MRGERGVKEGEGAWRVAQECELRRWNNPVCSLLDARDSQDLKQSIHEGPDIRMEHHRFEMLDGFGREIKESTMSISH